MKKIFFILIVLLNLFIMTGCDNKINKNIKETIEASKTILEVNEVNITKKTEDKNYKTVSYYENHKKERKEKIKECENAYMSNRTEDIECDNAIRARQLEKRKNAEAFIRNH